MVDFFAVLLQPGAGDELQGMKKGVLELADALIVNKADGELLPAAKRARVEYQHALQLLRPASSHWRPPVLLASARTGDGIGAVWETVLRHRQVLEASGDLAVRRRSQARSWLWALVSEGLERALRDHPAVAEALPRLEAEVEAGKTTPAAAARALLAAFSRGC
jgi:LAO/AO transport system kinase